MVLASTNKTDHHDIIEILLKIASNTINQTNQPNLLIQSKKNNGVLILLLEISIRVITKLPNSEQSYKGKVKTNNYINRQNQSITGKLKTVMTLTWYRHF